LNLADNHFDNLIWCLINFLPIYSASI